MTATDEYTDALLARFEGDAELLREVIALFRDDSAALLEGARAGLAAGDAAELQRAAHTLKGSASNFLPPGNRIDGSDPASKVVGAALALERLAKTGNLASATEGMTTLEDALAELRRRLGAW
jgi:hypothetical protein